MIIKKLSGSNRQLALNIMVLCLTLLWLEVIVRVMFSFNFRGFESTRKLMTGEAIPAASFQRVSDQPYLLYIPTPNYRNKHGLQHNAHGYRGRLVYFQKRPDVIRILCMGGSTTYGWGVDLAEHTYPAFLEKFINEDIPENIREAEVINAGIPSGTTAEILTHYLFKFSYYKPDIVIINAGGNDARALHLKNYHPDYSHTRMRLQLPGQVSFIGRIILQSRLLSLIVISTFYGTNPSGAFFYSYHGGPPIAPWFKKIDGPQWEQEIKNLSKEEIALYHNLDILLDILKKHNVKVLLLPFRPNISMGYQPVEITSYMEQLLVELARKHNVAYAPFPESVISKKNWVDECHLNAEGNKQKARYLVPFLKQLIR